MTPGKHSGASARAANGGAWGYRDFRGGQKKGWCTTPQLVATMPVSPAGSHKQQNFGLNNATQPKKSISFFATMKATSVKGYTGANQSRMAVSKTVLIPPELKTVEKPNPNIKTTQVFDINGTDVTPRPLYHPDPLTGTAKPSKLLTSQEGSLGSEFISSYSLYQNTINPSTLGQFTRSVLGSSTVSKSSVSASESIAEDLEEPSYKRERLTSFTDLQVIRAAPEKIVTKEDLEKNIEIILTETETLRFFDLPTVMVSVESEEAEKVTQRNKNYEVLCRNRLGNDLYVERMMQTFNGAPKNKDVQCDKIIMEDKGIMSTAWDLYDSYNAMELVSLSVKQSVVESSSKANVLPKDQDQRLPGSTTEKKPEPEEPEDVLESAKHEEVEEESKKEEEEEIHAEESTIPANLERLWSFSCDLTKGLNVSSLAWNKTNPDLLAVGYGHFGFKEQKRGLACCWSIKNPMWPERIYQSPYGVTAVDFSIGAPNLLAVGYHNGTIAIYNVRSNSNVPVLDSSESPQKHLGPVWQLQWIEQDRGTTGDGKREILVSISADGRISKWVIRKGLDCYDLMRLKRTTAASNKKGGEKEKKDEALISRQAPGMCFAFHPKGPVYKVTWNPFCHDVFLSCSADWGVIIWQQENVKPSLSFYPATSVVYDVAWSPKSSYIFAAANENRVEIWDLHISTLDPLIVNTANPGIKFTTILFAKQTDCLLVGDSDGQVSVYELRNMPTVLETGRGDIMDTLLGSKSNQSA
ncbi:dynein axonemal intermediate chain 4 isoform X7 [Homo sapiens]|uniref:dynein axonemal intermediate chain 4 isoform X7 n=1 Tax=Homo sapiens TaxID=9606 RepID=UPI0007DC6582|nr:dynein axonemal intermediate chain 4 isoform X7 [Homo sapiens]|eukprot:XP_016857842.1 WD repeat-containing protein 78 isoform X5 [Homo sapiens]